MRRHGLGPRAPRLPRVRRGLAASDRVFDLLKTMGGDLPPRLSRLWKAWPDLVGPDLAAMARPLGHRRRSLILGGEDPIVLQELSFFAGEFLDKANAFLGEEFFDKVLFELIHGRASLDSERPPVGTLPRPKLTKIKNLGKLDYISESESALGRCYRAYVRLMAVPDPGGSRRSK